MLCPPGMNKQSPAKSPDISSIQDSVQTLIGQGTEAVDAIKARVESVTGDAREQVTAAYDKSTAFIKANPGKSIALAFGIGYVAMRIRTSKLFPLAMIGGIGYLVRRNMA